MKNNFLQSKKGGFLNWICTFALTIFGILVSVYSGVWNKWICLVIILILAIYPFIYSMNEFANVANLKDSASRALDLKQTMQEELDNLACFDSLTIQHIEKAIGQIEAAKLKFEAEWGYESRAKILCKQIFETVKKYSKCDEVEVLITMKIDEKIRILCYDNCRDRKPETRLRDISCSFDSRLDQKYFLKYADSSPQIDVSSSYEITEHDFYKSNAQYEQFIFTPITVGEEASDLIGLVEVTSMKGKKMANSDEALLEIAKNAIVPYAKQIALLYNIERVMKAKPTDKEAMKSEK